MKKQLERKEILKLYLWTLSYFKPVILLTLFYILCGGIMIWGELMIPRRMGYVIDNVLPLKEMVPLRNQILILCGIVVLILILKAIFYFLEQIIANKITKNQQTDLMVKLQKLGFSYYEKVPTGQIISLFENAVKETQQTYTFLFPQFIYNLAKFVVPSIVLIFGEPIFFIAAMIGNIIYVFVNQFANKKIHYYLGVETKAAHASQQSLYDAIVAKTELKAMGSKDWFIEKTIEDFNQFRIPRMWSVFWRHFRYTTVGLTLTISIFLFYFYGLDLVKSGELLLGEFIGYSFLMGLVSRGFSVFFYIIPAQYHALNYAKYLHDFLKLEPDVREDNNCLKVELDQFDIEFKNVSFAYKDSQPIINNLSLIIPAGKKTAIVGESGSGKSTLLKLIGRFYDVNQGQILMGGYDIKKLKLEHLRQNFGYVFQDTYLFNMSIRDNIKFGNPDASDEEVIKASKLASAHQFIMETEDGYDTIVGEGGVRLSGGQKQRISIARMLLKKPPIILLDEATSALDNVTEAAVKQSLEKLAVNKTVVTVAHRLSTIMDYDSIIVLKAGKIVEEGTYQSLMDQKGLFYQLVIRGVNDEL
ncbi:ATP-binding cassette subfamily B protein [Orenia metallireducens]|uniref:ATP-binding cassette, subfamily B/ATP-binding cassette, subfamily B, MsbA n=1 Tax=Orenia metallireducens TaxID=1413210 RepID=A0A285I143_9FIRM|nr:ABC transporter ATP-binding protein [Orenia metallireducens]PRX29282.1 ATP-binding cassette subfamily B protein [Orenia metallireducens]SNY40661.1 ATP-binding cassette, subfamily B/ATP-binding cassette, subfamily B, MsbA [Orenia metallireducens]